MIWRNFVLPVFCTILSGVLVSNEAARILAVFPVPSISHQVVFRPLTQELARRGHELVILTPDPAFPKGETPDNITEIGFHDMSYDLWRKGFTRLVNGEDNAFKIIDAGCRLMVDIFDKVLELEEVKHLFHSNQTFDLILGEACVNLPLVMSHIFKAPVIQISSLGALPLNHHTIGTPSHPVIFPELLERRVHNLSFWEKIYAVYSDLRFKSIEWNSQELEYSLAKKHFGPDIPTMNELFNNVHMLFLNMDPVWVGNRATPPGVIYMGGLHQKPEKELPKDLKNYLDNSKNGVIYISFGTNVNPSLLPSDRIELLAKVFSKLPYDVIWKFDKGEMQGTPKNVRLHKWVPQSDLLRHPKIKLFITQAGLQSTDEAITAGVPLVAFPMLGDQWYNAEKYVHLGIGVQHDLATITEESLEKSILEVIENRSYRDSIVRLRTLMRDQPQTPLERAVWWTEYVIRHGGAKHLRSAAANISWTEYLMLDAVAVALGSLLVALGLIVMVLSHVYRTVVKHIISIKVKND